LFGITLKQLRSSFGRREIYFEPQRCKGHKGFQKSLGVLCAFAVQIRLRRKASRTMLYLIGLTGNIATGKSLVGRMLGELGAHVIDADALVRELQRKGTPVYDSIVAEFGPDILRSDGEIDRARLGSLVFSDPDALRRLEAIVHPAVGAELKSQISNLNSPKTETRIVIVIEAIKLIEAGLHKQCNSLWVVTSRPEAQRKRLMRTRGLSQADAKLRIEAQPPQSDKAALADVLIENNGTFAALRSQVKHYWDAIPLPR
jgi:dephospho-CoA kinase